MSSLSFLYSQTRRVLLRQAPKLRASVKVGNPLGWKSWSLTASPYHSEHTFSLLRSSHTWTQAVQDAESLMQHPGGSYINPDTLVGEDVTELSSSMSDFLDLEHPILRTMSKYYLDDSHKHIHPLIVLMMSRAVNGPGLKGKDSNGTLPEQRSLSEITEMIHTASLIHDDVLDYSMSENTPETAAAAKGNKLSVLGGDFLLARASMGLARLRVPEVVELIALAIENQVQGEFMKADEALTENLTLECCLDQIYLKYASLMANSCKAAAILGQCESEIVDAAYQYGKELGIAIQLHQDLLEWKAAISEKRSDFNPSIYSGPLVLAIERSPVLKDLIKHSAISESNSSVLKVYDIVRETKALERTSEIVANRCQSAMEIARSFPSSDAQQMLIKLPQSMSGAD
ncbi:terpenoid synthase [Basidiobolus meristosporus CBS 931.73]|uniref:Terpenoid synthase n=1 Tax=Basidiobolus meristosporus CBS 931.73 TaxID=1314790 RepID=A0A1Y1XT30_9FUNG|nr:terpenoid synthase [Basidiobolus meristosporus CBS 931.73]|eukprot:ORX88890.1 terpenoid synthase [Basidiobolus meristosporus CBS 931.73]